MKKMTIGELLKSERSHLNMRTPAILIELLQAEADKAYGGNKSLLIVSILAQRYKLLASD